jgi:adenine-specific DNA-methyltransferase
MSGNLPLVHAERLMERTEARRVRVAAGLDARQRARWGQFFTPAPIAIFLAGLLDVPEDGRWRVLDPGAGIGSLSAAVVAEAIRSGSRCSMKIVAFEMDDALVEPLQATMRDCERTAADAGLELTTEVRPIDFLEWASTTLTDPMVPHAAAFDACVMNPPYRKINTGSPDRVALERIGLRVTNVYAAFMAAAAALLKSQGQLSAITPRSFANGPYFLPFRQFFLSRMGLDHLHVYERRSRVFSDADVLQENVVLRATRGETPATTLLSTSVGGFDKPRTRIVPYREVVDWEDPHLFVHIPVDAEATQIAGLIADLPCGIGDLSVAVSTGRVVDFRTRANLINVPELTDAPLIYPGHLRGGSISWPVLDGRKPNGLAINAETAPLLLPTDHYVLVKRFTAKEERRRVVASAFGPSDIRASVVAFENHLNVFHRAGRGLEMALAAGLTVFLNTTLVDTYVRQFSGHTQINATDLRTLRYPSRDSLLRLGAAAASDWPTEQTRIDALAAAHIPAFATRVDIRAA